MTTKSINFYLLILVIVALYSCNQQTDTSNDPIKVILDTDMGSDCDDVGALAILHEYAKQGKVEILAVVYSSGAVPYGAGIVDAINRYYGHDEIPVGATHDYTFGDTVDKMQAEKLAKDTAAFGNKIVENKDTPEQTELLRKILSKQADKSVVYITIGHTKGLYDLLHSRADQISDLNGMELAEQKIEKWIALGAKHAYHEEDYYVGDWNFWFNGSGKYSDYLVDNYPGPVYFVDAGDGIMTGSSLIETERGNIIRTAYRDWLWTVEKKQLSDQRPSWDLMAVMYAVEKQEDYFTTIKGGYLDFDVEKGSRWIMSDSSTNHHYVLHNKGVEEEIAEYLNELLSQSIRKN